MPRLRCHVVDSAKCLGLVLLEPTGDLDNLTAATPNYCHLLLKAVDVG